MVKCEELQCDSFATSFWTDYGINLYKKDLCAEVEITWVTDDDDDII